MFKLISLFIDKPGLAWVVTIFDIKTNRNGLFLVLIDPNKFIYQIVSIYTFIAQLFNSLLNIQMLLL